MELREYEYFADACFRDSPPPCASVCPFTLDVREFAKLMQRGSLASAYRVFRAASIFPAIVSAICPAQCTAACVRSTHDRGVDLRSLERACVAHAGGKPPTRYSMPAKEQAIAVIGGGMSGLSCAQRLSSHGYHVTVYEKNDTMGGAALQEMDAQACLAELEREFSVLPSCEILTGHGVLSIDDIHADAIYVATGSSGDTFGLDRASSSLGEKACSGSKDVGGEEDGGGGEADAGHPGVFLGGRLMGCNTVESIAWGLAAADAIEKRLLAGKAPSIQNATGVQAPDTRYYQLEYDFSDTVAADAAPGGAASTGVAPDASAKAPKGEPEAARCLRCNCENCFKSCPLMQKERSYPKRMCTDVVLTLKPNMSKRTGTRMVATCTYCKRCEAACPVGIDMGSCLDNARCDLYEDGALPPAFHDYWVQDMEFSLSNEAYLVWREDDGSPSRLLLFPGCQLAASSPDSVAAAFSMVSAEDPNAAIYLGCCGTPAQWAGMRGRAAEIAAGIAAQWERLGRPTFLVACPACLASLADSCPQVEAVSLYQWLAGHAGVLPIPEGTASIAHVLDPCTAAADRGAQDAVRKLARRYGYAVEDEADVGCCGFGGHIYTADPTLSQAFSRRRVEGLAGTLIAYCANCRDMFSMQGADCRHILEVIAGIESPARPPELGQRRENRRRLKRVFTKEEAPMQESGLEVAISQELIDRMNASLILREQVEDVIRSHEASGEKIYDEETGLFYAHGRYGAVTIWAAYRLADGAAVLEKVYSHRVDVKE